MSVSAEKAQREPNANRMGTARLVKRAERADRDGARIDETPDEKKRLDVLAIAREIDRMKREMLTMVKCLDDLKQTITSQVQ
jgi:hypothetical protein